MALRHARGPVVAGRASCASAKEARAAARGASAVFLVALTAAGCAATTTPGLEPSAPAREPARHEAPEPARREARAPRTAPATDELARNCPDARDFHGDGQRAWWETFRRTNEAMHLEIERRSDALRSGPIGNRARELASLRLAASARELLEAGSRDGAREALERAVSLDSRNGYASLLLAYLATGPAAERLAGEAERTLPRDPGVRCELEGLRSELRNQARNGYGRDDAHSRN